MDNALRASFRGVGRANNDDAGDLRFKCDRDEKGARGGRRFLSLRKPLTGCTTTGERAGGTHLPFSVLTAAQQGFPSYLSLSLFTLPAAVPCAISSLSLTLSPLILHPPGRPSRLLRCTDVAIRLRARETRVHDVASHLRQRIRQRVVFALCVMLRLRHPDPDVDIVGSLSLSRLFLSNFPPSLLLPLWSDLVRL